MAGVRPVDELRVGKAGSEAEDATADGAVDAGNSERRQPKLVRAHAEGGGLLGVVAQRTQMQTEGGAHDAPHEEGSKRAKCQAIVVEGARQQFDLVVGGEL